MNKKRIVEFFVNKLTKKLHEALYNVNSRGDLIIDLGDEGASWDFADNGENIIITISSINLQDMLGKNFMELSADLDEGMEFSVPVSKIQFFLESPDRFMYVDSDDLGVRGQIDRKTASNMLDDWEASF